MTDTLRITLGNTLGKTLGGMIPKKFVRKYGPDRLVVRVSVRDFQAISHAMNAMGDQFFTTLFRGFDEEEHVIAHWLLLYWGNSTDKTLRDCVSKACNGTPQSLWTPQMREWIREFNRDQIMLNHLGEMRDRDVSSWWFDHGITLLHGIGIIVTIVTNLSLLVFLCGFGVNPLWYLLITCCHIVMVLVCLAVVAWLIQCRWMISYKLLWLFFCIGIYLGWIHQHSRFHTWALYVQFKYLRRREVTLYHQTSLPIAHSIMETQTMHPGKRGALGGAIYLALTAEDTYAKALSQGIILRVTVRLGSRWLVLTNCDPSLTAEAVLGERYTCVCWIAGTGTEFAVYKEDQVVRIEVDRV